MTNSQPSSPSTGRLEDVAAPCNPATADPRMRREVLVVEHEPALRSVLVATLQEAGMLPLEAPTLTIGAEALQQQEFPAIVMSLDWPWEETWTLLTELRRRVAQATASTSCVFISILSTSEAERSFGRLPGTHFTKPINSWEVVASLMSPDVGNRTTLNRPRE